MDWQCNLKINEKTRAPDVYPFRAHLMDCSRDNRLSGLGKKVASLTALTLAEERRTALAQWLLVMYTKGIFIL